MADKQGPDFAMFVQTERTRLMKAREDTLNQMQIIQAHIEEIDTELRAIEAYVATKEGRAPVSAPARGPSKMRKARRTGGRKGAIREELISLIKAEPQGLTRADLIGRRGVKGDKSGEQSISNALTNMKKAGQLTQDNGRYYVTQQAAE